MRRSVLRLGVLGALALLATGCPAQESPARAADGPPATSVWLLPPDLREISGLAVGAGGRVFAHDDEQAVIYELDPGEQRVVRRFALSDGRRPLRGDFEGLAIVGDTFYLINSAGTLYRARENSGAEPVPHTSAQTGLGELCEIEGLAYDPALRKLVAACKAPRQRALRGRVTLVRWAPGSERPADGDRLEVPLEALTRGSGLRGFHPSGIEHDPATGHYLVVAAIERALAEITPTGRVVGVWRLHPRHRQAEGIALLGGRTLLLADEGERGSATLTRLPLPR